MNLIEAIYENGVFRPVGNPGFVEGQRVRIIPVSENKEYAMRTEKFRELFKRTQSLPQLQTITEDDIIAEIKAYRTEKQFTIQHY